MAVNGPNWWAQIAHLASHLRVRSALNPILWLVLIVGILFFGAAYAFRDYPEIRNWLIAVPIVTVLVALLAFIGFAIFRPHLLQSEEYQLQHESLQMMQQRRNAIVIDPTTIPIISNPAPPAPGTGPGTGQDP